MNSRQPPISNRAQFLQLTRQTRMLYYAECSNRPKGEESSPGLQPLERIPNEIALKGRPGAPRSAYYSAGEVLLVKQ
jgi:hypothetical protein